MKKEQKDKEEEEEGERAKSYLAEGWHLEQLNGWKLKRENNQNGCREGWNRKRNREKRNRMAINTKETDETDETDETGYQKEELKSNTES